jgi:hypothetical protein
MFEQLGAVVTAERERTPVRKSSRPAGRCEGLFWRRITPLEANQIRIAAERYDLATKTPGARNGALGGVGLQVLNYLTRLVNDRTGRLDPSIDYLMAKLKRSRDAIVRALKALRAHGFLDWLRRYVPTGNHGRGPQVVQTSNAYRLSLPERARRLLGRLVMSPPLPCDFAYARAAQAADIEAYQRSLPLENLPAFLVEDSGIAAALSRMAIGIKQRESAKRTEFEQGSYSMTR